MTIGTFLSSARISRTTSRPLLPGIFQSVRTRSKPPLDLNNSIACWPSHASTAPLTPRLSSDRRMIVRMVPESSANSTRMMNRLPVRDARQHALRLAGDEPNSHVEETEVDRPQPHDDAAERRHFSVGGAQLDFDLRAHAKHQIRSHQQRAVRKVARHEDRRSDEAQAGFRHVASRDVEDFSQRRCARLLFAGLDNDRRAVIVPIALSLMHYMPCRAPAPAIE